MTTPGNSPETPASAPSPTVPGPAESAADTAAAASTAPTAPVADPTPRAVAVEVRTAPKIWPFLVTGAVLGAIVAFVVTWVSHAALVAESDDGTTENSFGSTFGFMFMIFGVLGLAVAGLVFILVDRVGRRAARTVDVVVEPVTDDPDDSSTVKE